MAKFTYKSVVRRKSYLDTAGSSSLLSFLTSLQMDTKNGEGGLLPSDYYKISKKNTKITNNLGATKINLKGNFSQSENGTLTGTIKSMKQDGIMLDTKITMTLKDIDLKISDLADMDSTQLQKKIFKGDDTFTLHTKKNGFYKKWPGDPGYGGGGTIDDAIIMGKGNDKLIISGPLHVNNLISTGTGKDEIILRRTKEGQPHGLNLIDIDKGDIVDLRKVDAVNDSEFCSYSSKRWNVIADTKYMEQILISTGRIACRNANIIFNGSGSTQLTNDPADNNAGEKEFTINDMIKQISVR